MMRSEQNYFLNKKKVLQETMGFYLEKNLARNLRYFDALFFTKGTTISCSNARALSNQQCPPKFTNPHNLPKLPVPKLGDTLEKYLKSARPFLDDCEVETSKQAIRQFEQAEGPVLQKVLEERYNCLENWLTPWWEDVAYLSYRDPVTVFSSPGLVFPFQNFKNEEERLSYTAKLILANLDYKQKIDDDKIPLDKMGKDTLDMNQYKKIYGTNRIPGVRKDTLEFNPKSRHIIVVKNNNYFKLTVLNTCLEPPSLKQLITELQEVVEKSKTPGPAIGILTSDNRDNWGEAYQILIQDDQNKASVKEIEQSLFIVCLDRAMKMTCEGSSNRRSLVGKQCIHGGGSNANSGNRWFDKTIQFIVGADGNVGLTYEHSPSEGQPIAVLTDYLVEYVNGTIWKTIPDSRRECGPQALPFDHCDVCEAIDTASQNVNNLVKNLDLYSFQFDMFGKNFVKAQKLSPDSFIQMAMQLAYVRMHREAPGHYESAATRRFIHGRTETIRSCSCESIHFANVMLDNTKRSDVKVEALKKAIDAHKKYTLDAVNGLGVDRHLTGLKLAAMELKMDLPKFYSDPAYTRSTYMRISSSQVATKCDGFMCYGPLVPDGYGCCYNPRDNDMNFSVSAFKDNPKTDAEKFKTALECSLKEMHDALAKVQKSKL